MQFILVEVHMIVLVGLFDTRKAHDYEMKDSLCTRQIR